MNNEESILKGFSSGGVDYITKPFKTLELLARTRTHIELKHAREALLRMATTDELTGLANRRHFMENLHAEFDRARRYGTAFSLIMMDIDHFKHINDTWGHKAGDLALQQTALTLKHSLRTSDIVGRVGGEEFAILLPETEADAAQVTAEKLRQAVEALSVHFDGNRIPVTISGGVAGCSGDDTGIDEIYIRADSAMYQAKKDGRNLIRRA
jgi:diguanylate cyclase (GGDEF)-like protein